jgi:hypothetical protein
MIRNPVLDFYAGALLALGAPMALLLPQRLFLAMLTPEAGPRAAPRVGRTDDAA